MPSQVRKTVFANLATFLTVCRIIHLRRWEIFFSSRARVDEMPIRPDHANCNLLASLSESFRRA